MAGDEPKAPEPEVPEKYRSIDDGTYRGYEVGKPQCYRDRKNAHRNKPVRPMAEGTDDNPLDW